jgi:hypothetical protein
MGPLARDYTVCITGVAVAALRIDAAEESLKQL